MSLFDQRMSSAAVPLLMHHNADDVSVTLAGGEPVSLRAIIGFEEHQEDGGSDALRLRLARDITVVKVTGCTPQPVSTAYPYGGLPSGELTATVTINSQQYAVQGVISESGSLIRLALTQTKVMDKSRPGMRRKP